MNKIDTKQFIRVFKDIDENSPDRKFCFILGAGASRSSGIPTGGEIAKDWFNELKDTLNEDDFNNWKKEKNLIEDDLPTYYGVIYEKRFCHDKQSGYDYLNKLMEKARPGFGYSVIAQLLSKSKNNIIITTNFDSLCEEALFTYSYKKFWFAGMNH